MGLLRKIADDLEKLDEIEDLLIHSITEEHPLSKLKDEEILFNLHYIIATREDDVI